MKALDLTGQIFGRLTVVSRAENSKRGKARWDCRCECGGVTTTTGEYLRSGHTKSCGCFNLEAIANRSKIHGMSRTAEYRTWTHLKGRAINPNDAAAKHYRDRGIEVCPQWRNSFDAFYRDMGPRPSLEHSIDRIDNSKGYFKENCRWATPKEQARNKRNNYLIEFNGQTRCIAEWSELLGIPYNRLHWRIASGWSVQRALTTSTQR